MAYAQMMAPPEEEPMPKEASVPEQAKKRKLKTEA